MPAIVVLGSLNLDMVVRTHRIPAPGETVLGSDFQIMSGGKGANQAYAVARLSAAPNSVAIAGKVGRDPFGERIKATLAQAGVDISSIRTSQDAATGIAQIQVQANGQNSIVVAPGANFDWRSGEVEALRMLFRGARYALFQLENPLEVVAEAMKLAREEGAITILDPAPARELPREILELADILTPNESEARILLGRQPAPVELAEAPAIASALCESGAQEVILKLGEKGCYLASRKLHVPAISVTPVDSTAAGDTFNAALAVALSEGRDWPQALRFANVAAGLSTTRAGAQASVPSRSEVDARALL